MCSCTCNCHYLGRWDSGLVAPLLNKVHLAGVGQQEGLLALSLLAEASSHLFRVFVSRVVLISLAALLSVFYLGFCMTGAYQLPHLIPGALY